MLLTGKGNVEGKQLFTPADKGDYNLIGYKMKLQAVLKTNLGLDIKQFFSRIVVKE